jgi:excisionase family DNA binding protein
VQPRLLHSIPQAAEVLGGVSRSVLYEKIKGGEIATVKVGRRTYITHAELERYVRSLAGESDA